MIQTNNRSLMILMTFLFFMWGFITCLNDILVPHLKDLFQLDYTKALLIQFCFFLTYAIMSLPMSKVVSLLGYKRSMVIGLLITAVGCLLFLPAAGLHYYGLFLFGLFVLASGIVTLQVAANPCVTLLGTLEKAASRLTFAQALNSLGTTLAPLLLGAVIIVYSVQIPYVGLAILLVLLAIIIGIFKFPNFDTHLAATAKSEAASGKSVWRQPQVMLGGLAIFMYVGAEVSTGSLLVNYMELPDIAGIAAVTAAKYLAFFWGGAMVGRFIGAWILTRLRANSVITFNAAIAILLLIICLVSHGAVAMWAVLAIGLFNSILFPTIFSLAIEGLGPLRPQAAGVLCTAIVGGAVVPQIQGILADCIGLHHSFALLIICYAFIVYYGARGYRH